MRTMAAAMQFMKGGRAAVAAAVLWGSVAVAQAAPTIDDFFRLPLISEVQLSPSGRYLAMVVVGAASARARLGIVDLDERDKPPKIIAHFDDADVIAVKWLDDQRLVFGANDSDLAVEHRLAQGLWAIDRDGGAMRVLIKRYRTPGISEGGSRIERRQLEPDHHLHSIVNDGSGDVIVLQRQWDNLGDAKSDRIFRLDTRTAALRRLGSAPDAYVNRWVVDAKGEPRAALSVSGGRARLYWRAVGSTDWALLADEPRFAAKGVSPLWVDDDTLFVSAAHGPQGLSALFRYDIAAKRPEAQPLFAIDGFSYEGGREFDLGTGRTVGIHYDADAQGSHWFDPALQAAQREVDAQLRSTVNRLSCSRCIGMERLVVSAHSDRQPPVFYLYDARTRKLENLGASRPWIDPKQMAQQDFVVVKARDGRAIPTYVTRPAGKSSAPRPAVVLVHGGPHIRGNVWGWDAQAQFLASRGYVVIEPEFRGSAGFGGAHLAAGFKQWGLAMQDDVTDATLWAVREAGVDERRICIAGASYGGYAALMGLVREPALYRCGIDWVGVTDPALMFSLAHSDLTEEWKNFGLRQMLGDPVADKERFTQTSPIAQAARIKQPLLLAYGGVDRRVPLEHGTRFRDAVMQHNRDVEWVLYSDEGHGFGDPKNLRDFWGRVEKFLDRNIGSAKP